MKKLKHVYRVLVGLAAGLAACASQAAPICGSSGALSACVDFSLSGTTLTVTLTNTGAVDVMDPSQVLTAVFFNASSLTPVSAISGGPTYQNGVVYNGQNAGTNVGGEWAYKSGLVNGLNSGISSAGFGLFGAGNFNGPDLFGPPSGAVDGVQYGLLSAGDNPATGNTGVLSDPLTKNSVIFTLSGFTGTLPTSVFFQYGTALTEPGFPSCTDCPGPGEEVPEPGTLALLGLALAGLGFVRRRQPRVSALRFA